MKSLREVVGDIKQSESEFYIYVLYKPNFVPFYVGKGKSSKYSHAHCERVEWHEYEATLQKFKKWSNRLKINTIRKIWNNGESVLYAIDSWHKSEADAYRREVELIASIGKVIDGKGPLTNITNGGEKGVAEPTPEIKAKIAKTLSEYYSTPEGIAINRARLLKYHSEHPEAADLHRDIAIKYNTAECLARWKKEKPEEFAAKQAAHSDEMKIWYAENPEAAKQMAENRNAVLRTDSHRQKMAEKTREYNKNNPEANRERREKANGSLRKTIDEHNDIKQKCLWFVHDRLVEMGVLRPTKKNIITMSMVNAWRKRGYIEKYFPTLPKGYVKKECWKDFIEDING